MSKLKNHKGATKRFIISSDNVKHRNTNRSHLNTKVSSKKVRQLRHNPLLSGSERKRVLKSISKT
jgi:large subunit ribosomal protein L35